MERSADNSTGGHIKQIQYFFSLNFEIEPETMIILTNGLPSVNFVFNFEVWDPLPDCVEEFVGSEAHGVDIVSTCLQGRGGGGHHAEMEFHLSY